MVSRDNRSEKGTMQLGTNKSVNAPPIQIGNQKLWNMASHKSYPPVLSDMIEYHYLPPIPPDLQPQPPHRLVFEPEFRLDGPPNPFGTMGPLAVSYPCSIDMKDVRPPITQGPPPSSYNIHQPWLNTASAKRSPANNQLPAGPLTDAQRSSSRKKRELRPSPARRSISKSGLATAQSRRRVRLSSPYPLPVPLEASQLVEHDGRDQLEEDGATLPSIEGAAEDRVFDVSSSPPSTVDKVGSSKQLILSDLASQPSQLRKIILIVTLTLGDRRIKVSENYLAECRDCALEIFPRKLAGFGGAIDKAALPHVRQLANKALSPAKSALLLLIIHYGHINMEPTPEKPAGLSVDREEFAQLTIEAARNKLSTVVWGRTKFPSYAILATLLLGYHSLHEKGQWSTFLPILRKALEADQKVVLTRQKHGERFGSGARGQEVGVLLLVMQSLTHALSKMRRRASFGLMVLDAYHNPDNYILSNAESDSIMPINLDYDEIAEGQLVLEAGEDTSSDISLLMLNGRLLIAKIRLFSVLRQNLSDDRPIRWLDVSEDVLTAIKSYAGELNNAIVSMKGYAFPLLERALEEINTVMMLNGELDVRKLVTIVNAVPLVELEERT
ncbi:hypothetical protein SISNIDRAFT_468762 [Sistotremastrum niveocremeum HHB9708]|uniref:Uncharacterized protein n=1 Tax=Sistotremastrum niveocremeum HHB9708 TaxID=1314777 RepID=A0A164QZ27_9AGAM|nr:hypothetical protein SISNIDRAFT_468762 [Sistotremastrum niveocremeum HHB9708]